MRSFEKNIVLQEFPCGSCPDPIPSLKLNCKARNFTTISIFHRFSCHAQLLCSIEKAVWKLAQSGPSTEANITDLFIPALFL